MAAVITIHKRVSPLENVFLLYSLIFPPYLFPIIKLATKVVNGIVVTKPKLPAIALKISSNNISEFIICLKLSPVTIKSITNTLSTAGLSSHFAMKREAYCEKTGAYPAAPSNFRKRSFSATY